MTSLANHCGMRARGGPSVGVTHPASRSTGDEVAADVYHDRRGAPVRLAIFKAVAFDPCVRGGLRATVQHVVRSAPLKFFGAFRALRALTLLNSSQEPGSGFTKRLDPFATAFHEQERTQRGVGNVRKVVGEIRNV